MSNANPEGSRFRWQGFDFIFVTEENHPWKNWLCFKHPDGQWVSLHKCESADLATWKARAEKAEASWRCFHCDEVFTDEKEARLHFGIYGETGTPACKVDAAHLRDLEAQLRSYRNEDTDLHRKIQSMETEHSIALRREEEKGYAKGLKDYTALEAERDNLKAICGEAAAESAAWRAKLERWEAWAQEWSKCNECDDLGMCDDHCEEFDNLLHTITQRTPDELLKKVSAV